jgi:protein-ribulosamine 3-kinase
MEPWMETVCAAITDRTNTLFSPERSVGVGGGSISQGFRLTGRDGRRFFVKRNHARRRAMFEAEAAGLVELARCRALRIPEPIALADHGDACFLILEYLDLSGRPDGARLGHGIAAMHAILGEHFGWTQDNFIGSTPQPNPIGKDWTAFYREHRLAFQRRLAEENGADRGLIDAVSRLESELNALLDGHHPAPSLLHGDLWSGNWGFVSGGMPTLFDPAVHYGDREADLAMMELFGHPGADFFAAYSEHQPLDAGYPLRRELYNLYHILNHFNLFGGGYAAQAERMARRLLAEVR